ncbi:Golgi pH regulator [Cyclospora cayetanensis]|uniref:Golgi pH regulator n=2 Tax=Cyclospora cayetanensis TaxID=88456 RepID=A0A6P5WD59_9EIME|nr:Golgi pH regulator [Cyclospora cayetanensis]OEH74661.1 hypothetical protein cyc_07153 [Cyclospora cayetanensis]
MTLPPLSAAYPLSQTGTGIVVGIIIVFLFHASLFIGAYYFFATHLYRDYEVQRRSVQHLFCATFTACVSMLQLLILELLHILNPHIRRFVWNLDLICVLLLLYIVIPVSIIHNALAPSADSFRIADWAAKFPQMQRLQTRAAALSRLTAVSNFGSSGSSGILSKLGRLSPRWREWVAVAACSAVVLPLLWFCFCQSGRLLHLNSDSLSLLSYTERLLAYVGVCGVTVVSALAGFGSVNYPYRNVATFLYPTTQAEVACVEQRLLHTLNLVSEKKRARLHLQASLNPARARLWPTPTSGVLSPPPGSNRPSSFSLDPSTSRRGRSASRRRYGGLGGEITSASRRGASGGYSGSREEIDGSTLRGGTKGPNAPTEPEGQAEGQALAGVRQILWRWVPRWLSEWLDRIRAFVTGRRLEQQCQKLQSEIEALEELSRELFVGLDDLVHSRAQALYGRTWLGRFNNLLGWGMTAVCVYRVFMSAANVLLDRVSTTDPATRTLELLLHLLHVPVNVTLMTPYLSLVLLGWIIALTIRGFFEKLLTVFRYMSTAVSSNVFALVMSEVMGMYFSACLLLTRVYLPQSYRDALAQVLAPSLDFRAFHLHFDRVFVLSSLACAISIAITHHRTAEKLKSL